MSTSDFPGVLLRADASTRMGTGHVMRALAIGEALRARGSRLALLGRIDSEALVEHVRAAGVEVHTLMAAHPHPQDLEATLHQLHALRARGASDAGEAPPPWLVVDGYHLDAAYTAAVRAAGYRVLQVDDMQHLPRYEADILLNQNAGAGALVYDCPPETQILAGPRFALVRREFRAKKVGRDARGTSDVPSTARQVLVTLGGADPDNVSARVIEAALDPRLRGLEWVVVIGASNPHGAELEALAARARAAGVELRLERNARMPELMAGADLAVGAGGITSYELAYMGVPMIVVTLADNQRRVTACLEQAGAAVALGWHAEVTASAIATAVEALARDRARRAALAAGGRALVDGAGGERIAELVGWLTPAPGGLPAREGQALRAALVLRPVTGDDVLALWRLANDPAVRAQSFSSAPIPLEDHRAWFARKLASPETVIFVAELAGLVAAVIRFERLDADTIELHFAVSSAFRGRGIGTWLLQEAPPLALAALPARRVRGRVLLGNVASLRTFARAAYDPVGEMVERGQRCRIFERSTWRAPAFAEK